MSSLLSILYQDDVKKTAKIRINLGGECETFDLITNDWSLKKYISQWKHAARIALNSRQTVGLIKRYESSKNHVKSIDIYTIIPKEEAYPNTYDESSGFYITESFMFISERLEVLSSNQYFDEIYESYGHYFPIYYFDENNISRFYLYLSDKVEGVSSWEVTNKDLRAILDTPLSTLLGT